MKELSNEISAQAFGNYIISMTHHASHVFEVFALARVCGLVSNIDGTSKSSIQITPLFETIDDLTRIEEILEDLFSNVTYTSLIGNYKNRKVTRGHAWLLRLMQRWRNTILIMEPL